MHENKGESSLTMLKERARVTFFLMAGMWIGLIASLAMTMFLSEPYMKYRKICYPISILVAYVASILSRKPGSISTLYEAFEYEGNKIYPVVSVMYLNFLTHKYTRAALLLIVNSVVFSLSLFLIDIEKYIISTNFIILVYAMLVISRLKLVERRILSGVFGDNPDEAMELINFILAHSDKVDFTDNDGRPKRCFLPEKLLATDQFPVGEQVTL